MDRVGVSSFYFSTCQYATEYSPLTRHWTKLGIERAVVQSIYSYSYETLHSTHIQMISTALKLVTIISMCVFMHSCVCKLHTTNRLAWYANNNVKQNMDGIYLFSLF